MKALNNAVKDFTEALNHVPAIQLMHIEETLRQLREDLTNSNLPILADLDTLIEDAAIAHAEVMAMCKDCEGPEEYPHETYYHEYCGYTIPVYTGDDKELPF